MLAKLWRYTSFRNFSNSVIWRNLEKKTTETSTNSSPQGYVLAKMPTNFEKKILIFSGRYKTMEEIPKLVKSETLDNAKSRARIKLANIMMVSTLIISGILIYKGKASKKEKIKKWEENQAAKAEEREKQAVQQH